MWYSLIYLNSKRYYKHIMSSCKDSSDSVQESLSVDTDSRCGVSGSCSGASLTAAVLTHVNHEDSEERGTTPESKCESIGEGEGECKGNEKSAAILLKSPQRSVRRRSKHSPSKKRESECLHTSIYYCRERERA